MNYEEIIAVIKVEIASVLNQGIDDIDEEANILKMGVSSLQALKIINKIRKKLDVDINPIALFEYKDIISFAGYLQACLQEKVDL